jgi:hypothetical protein
MIADQVLSTYEDISSVVMLRSEKGGFVMLMNGTYSTGKKQLDITGMYYSSIEGKEKYKVEFEATKDENECNTLFSALLDGIVDKGYRICNVNCNTVTAKLLHGRIQAALKKEMLSEETESRVTVAEVFEWGKKMYK